MRQPELHRINACMRDSVDSLFIAYLSFTTVLVITPGSTTAVVVRNTLHGGRWAGVSAAIGAALGNLSHAILAGLGLSVVFHRWPLAMVVLRTVGGLYLGWLGARSLFHAIRHPGGALQMASDETVRADRDARGSIRQGLVVNLLNPAIATFYLVVLPSFMPPTASRWHFAMLACIHIGLALLCHGMWAVALDRVRRLFRLELTRRLLEVATGAALVWLAARVVNIFSP